jgi:hypothetical protein
MTLREFIDGINNHPELESAMDKEISFWFKDQDEHIHLLYLGFTPEESVFVFNKDTTDEAE